jgi:flagellar biosynthetic protein FliP
MSRLSDTPLTARAHAAPIAMRTKAAVLVLASLIALLLVLFPGSPVSARQGTTPNSPATATDDGTGNDSTSADTTATGDKPSITVDLNDASAEGDGSGPLQIVLLVTLVALAPALLILVTSFTRVVIVLGLTRNALNLQGVPPNQVIIGLALFLSFFIMSPVLTEANRVGLQPYLDDEISQSVAFERASEPFKEFMLDQVREEDLALFVDLSGEDVPETPEELPLTTIVPAFVISELRAAFLIGFVVFIPFLIIDMVVSATLMSMGMVMVPPTSVALPFKLLLFVLVDGWQLLAASLVNSFVR